MNEYRCEDDKILMPNEVVGLHIMQGKTLLRAWREYKGVSIDDMSARMGISPSEYSEIEIKEHLPSQVSDRAAKALGIDSRLFEA